MLESLKKQVRRSSLNVEEKEIQKIEI